MVLCYVGWVLFQAFAYICFYLVWGTLWLLWFLIRLPFLLLGALAGLARE